MTKVFKLTKPIKLYKNQFDRLSTTIFKDYRIDRYSLDLDAIMFRIKYMTKHNKDLSNIDELKSIFVDTSMNLQKSFWKVIYTIVNDIVNKDSIYTKKDIKDLFIQDVKIDTAYVNFSLILISENKEYLDYVDNIIPENDVYNIFPNEFFRFYTDSYNDGIAKAYPELFANRHQDEVGTGADGDVFVHNFTFQTTESCSLNCFAKGSMVKMADGTDKDISEVNVGDMVLSVQEDIIKYDNNDDFYSIKNIIPTRVTRKYVRNGKYLKANWKDYDTSFYPTVDHPFLTPSREWLPFKEIIKSDNSSHGFVMYNEGWKVDSVHTHEIEVSDKEYSGIVYNLETESHTFIVEDLIVHNCTYCYQFNKTPMVMDFETAKSFIDKLLNDEYGYINRYNSPALILEFIGGEPLLQIDLTRKIYEYFLEQCYELNHPWFTLHRLSICSNGLQYFDDEVQDFFKEYASQISFNISIDGNRELHDACRIQPNGEGSYDIDITALNHYNKHYTPERNSKMTLAPENIEHLFDSVVNFINNGMKTININCVFEEGWTQETAKTEYYQLKKLANYILENNLDHLYIAIFNERQEDKQDPSFDGNHCGGLGSMLALRPNGQFYPCIRYMPTSVGNNVKDLCIGDVKNGLIGREDNSEILQMMDSITRRSQSNDICFDCPLGNSCAWCFKAGTLIETNKGAVPIEFLNIDDMVLSSDGKYHPVYQNLKRRAQVDETVLLTVSGHMAIYSTKEHPVWAKKFLGYDINTGIIYDEPKWIVIDELTTRDMVLSMNSEWVDIISIKNLNIEYDVYNLSVQDNPTFYANGILVHNCSALGHAVYGTPGKRPTFACIQMIAEALANVYYFNSLLIKHPEYNLNVRKNVVPDEWALLVIDEDELDFLKKLEAYAMIIYLENN